MLTCRHGNVISTGSQRVQSSYLSVTFLLLSDVQVCRQRLSSAFDLLLIFLCSFCSLIQTLTLTPPPNNASLANMDMCGVWVSYCIYGEGGEEVQCMNSRWVPYNWVSTFWWALQGLDPYQLSDLGQFWLSKLRSVKHTLCSRNFLKFF